MYIAFFDGAAQPNPGRLGIGFTVYKDDKELFCGAKPAGIGSNNRAEYLSLVWLLEECLKRGITQLTCFGDSQLVVNQVNKHWQVGSALQEQAKIVDSLIAKFEMIEIKWLKRAANKRADALSKRALELKEAHLHEFDSHTVDEKKAGQTSTKAFQLTRNNKRASVICVGAELAILAGKHTIYFNTQTLTCSCEQYRNEGQCIHQCAFNKINSLATKALTGNA